MGRKPEKNRSIFYRLKYPLLSIFLLLHLTALLLGPSPKSEVTAAAYANFEPYLELLNLDNGWAFFAPNPATGTQLKYRVRTKTGVERVFRLTEAVPKMDPACSRFIELFTLPKSRSPFEESLANYLGQQHADLQPTEIQFIEVKQGWLTVEKYRQGARPYQRRWLLEQERDWIDLSPPPSKPGAPAPVDNTVKHSEADVARLRSLLEKLRSLATSASASIPVLSATLMAAQRCPAANQEALAQ